MWSPRPFNKPFSWALFNILAKQSATKLKRIGYRGSPVSPPWNFWRNNQERMDCNAPNGQPDRRQPSHAMLPWDMLCWWHCYLPNLILCRLFIARGVAYSVHSSFIREYEYAGKIAKLFGGWSRPVGVVSSSASDGPNYEVVSVCFGL